MAAETNYLRNTQTQAGTGGTVYDLSTTQGTGATLGSGNESGTTFVEKLRFQKTVGDTVTGTSFPTSIDMASVSASTLEWRYRIQRINSSGVVQASSAYSTVYNTAGIKTETLTLSTTWAAGDRLAVSIELRKVSGGGSRTFTLNVNDADTWVEPDITVATDVLEFLYDETGHAAADSDPVSQWDDDSGNGRHLTQATSGERPIRDDDAGFPSGLPAVLFDGTDDTLATAAFSSPLTQPITFFFVIKMASTATDQNFLDGQTFAGGHRLNSYYYSPSDDYAMYAGGPNHMVGGAPDTTNGNVVTLEYNGDSSVLRVDGTQVATGGSGIPGGNDLDGLLVGADPAGSSPLNAWIGEIRAYSNLTSTTRDSIESALISKWLTAGATAVGKDLQLVWNTRDAVGDTAQLVWDTRAAVGDTVELQWNVRTSVGDSAELQWNTRQAVGDSAQLVWDVRAALADSLQLVWGVRTTVGDDSQLLWDVRQALGDTLQLVWNVEAIGITAVGKDLELLWNVRAAVGDPLGLVWNTRQVVGDDSQLVWDVRIPVGDPLELQWAVKQAVGDQTELRWQVLQAVADTLDLRWSVRQAAGKDSQLLWQILQAVGDQVELPWTVRQAVGDDLQLVWTTESNVLVIPEIPDLIISGGRVHLLLDDMFYLQL